VPRQILFALLLMLNHSLLLGASQAAYIPDELHPFGSAFPHEHLHAHAHETDHHHHEHGHSPDGHEQDDHALAESQPADSQPAFTTADAPDHDHDTAHSHGVHVPLNCDLPFSLTIALDTAPSDPPASRQHLHAGLAYAPPVPPPNV
jgi:hypothetical protein